MSIKNNATWYFDSIFVDINEGCVNNSGITTYIINSGLKYGKGGIENIKSAYRIKIYKHLPANFSMDEYYEEGFECKDLPQSAA